MQGKIKSVLKAITFSRSNNLWLFFLLFMAILFCVVPLISMADLFIGAAQEPSSYKNFGTDCLPSSLFLTFVYVISCVTLQMLLGIASSIAVYLLLLESRMLFITVVTILIIPYAVPSTIGFSLWEFGFAHGGTLQNTFFTTRSPFDGTWSRFAMLITVSVWQFFPFTFLLICAAFLAIPRELINTAYADGAYTRSIILRILLPLAMPVIAAAFVLRLILMATKLDTPLAFDATSSNDYACVVAVDIYRSLGLGVDSYPMGLILTLSAWVLALVLVYFAVQRQIQK